MSAAGPLELHVDIAGDGPPLVILHGLYGSATNWKRHATWLRERWRVLLPDLRNHGRSPHAAEMDYPALAGDVRRLLDDHGIEQAVLLGHSMGGKAAMTLALQEPERVRGLIAADIAPVIYQGGDHEAIIAAMQAVDLTATGSRRDAEPTLAGAVESAAIRQFLLTNLSKAADGWRWRLPLGTLRAALPALQSFPELPGRYEGPALFVHGARSDYVTEPAAATIREHFPQAEIRAITEAGHFLHVEQPNPFADTVAGFLRRHFSAE